MKTFLFTLNEQEANIVINALGHMPYQQVYQVIHSLQSQAKQQMDRDTEKKND